MCVSIYSQQLHLNQIKSPLNAIPQTRKPLHNQIEMQIIMGRWRRSNEQQAHLGKSSVIKLTSELHNLFALTECGYEAVINFQEIIFGII